MARFGAAIRKKHLGVTVVVLSQSGLAADLRLARIVGGIDPILGGHSHDPVFGAIQVLNRSGGVSYVTNAGSSSKFVNVCDLHFSSKGLSDIQCRLLPVLPRYLDPDPKLNVYIEKLYQPYLRELSQPLIDTTQTFYRRGTFNGSADELILSALCEEYDTRIAICPAYPWGRTVPIRQTLTVDDIYSWTARMATSAYSSQMTGLEIFNYLESAADDAFNNEPLRQPRRDMLRSRGLRYRLYPSRVFGYRIQDLRLVDGTPLAATRSYSVALWADDSTRIPSQSHGEFVWRILPRWLRSKSSLPPFTPFRPDSG